MIPDAPGTVAAAPPLDKEIPQLPRPGGAELFQQERLLHGKGELPQGGSRGDHRPAKAVFHQPRQRAGVVGMGMGEKNGVQPADLLSGQVGIRVLRRIRHFPAVHQKGERAPLDPKAAAAVFAHAARDHKLHITLPSVVSPQRG